jgi:hypothetical protein
MTRLTAMLIKNNGRDVKVDSAQDTDTGRWIGMINLWKDGRPHICPLIDTIPFYDSREEAEAGMQKIIDEIRAMPDL